MKSRMLSQSTFAKFVMRPAGYFPPSDECTLNLCSYPTPLHQPRQHTTPPTSPRSSLALPCSVATHSVPGWLFMLRGFGGSLSLTGNTRGLSPCAMYLSGSTDKALV